MFTTPRQCPTCSQPLETRELACTNCATVVRGRWAAGPFSNLTHDQITFLTLFVRSRGNLSDVERTLGVSYPTVRAKLDDLVAALDAPPAPPVAEVTSTRQAILQQIARGVVGVEEGIALLRQATRSEDEV
jgi:hypothetical protein